MVVAISLLGQLGMALYHAQTRVKEIGVRKVLGARLRSIIGRLLKGTIISLIIASLIATPLAYLAGSNFTPVDGIDLEVTPFSMISGFALFVLLVCGVIVLQTWRIASQNPSESLRYE